MALPTAMVFMKHFLWDGDKPVSGFRMNEIGYNETRYLNAHIDYKWRAGGPAVQHLSPLPGYNDGIYERTSHPGLLLLPIPHTGPMKITVSDADGNNSVLLFDVKRSGS